MSADTAITFTHAGSEFFATWLNDERSRLSVGTHETVEDENGVDVTDWPSNATVSRAVGKCVRFHDAGDAQDFSECIFHAE